MTRRELEQLDCIDGHLNMLKRAVQCGDPQREIEIRISDAIRELHKITKPTERR